MTEKNQVETKLLTQIKEVLSTFPEYWEEETLLRTKVAEDIRAYNEKVIESLLANELIKETYSITFDSTTIFKTEHFISMLRYKNYWENSYTKYTNEIGLTSEGKYLKYNTDVVLDFPHKDSLLEGGMTKEDKGKTEIYYHNVLAKEEIDTLFSPNILSNIKKYDDNGMHKLTDFTDKDNLIIKGNNLIALSLLKKRYENKVKMIYIDPPYNTGNDGFNYNDKFNHSTWLTFMKNRLELAKSLLTNDGVIFVQVDHNESHYLKILLDEIYGRENFINEIIWKRKFGNANETKRLGSAYDTIFLYGKTANYKINLVKEKNSKHVQEYIKTRFTRKVEEGKHKGKLWMPYPLANPGRPTKNLTYEYKGYKAPAKGWRMVKEKLAKLDEEEKIYFPKDKSQRLQEKKFLDEYDGQPVDSLWTDIFVINSQAKEALDFDGQKPENLLKRIIEIGSNEGDIVLDYHLGTGTTSVVAKKLNRQYIGIEQMDYINTISVPRLEKVIEGEQGGISKEVDWEGGGSFVYVELASLNDEYVKDIQASNSEENLETVLSTMKERAYLNFKVDLERIISDNEGYKSLTLEEKKNILIQSLDMNQLYLNYSEIEDTQHGISDSVKEFNRSFYEKEGDE